MVAAARLLTRPPRLDWKPCRRRMEHAYRWTAAIEDLLGAGAVLHHLDLACSPEAGVARGFAAGLELAVAQAASDAAPQRIERAYRPG
jgi:hypothetical protein